MNKKSFQLPNRIYSSKLAKQITHETHNPPFASYAVISSSQALDSFDGTCKGSNKIQFERNNQSISVILYRWCYIIQTNKSMNPSTIWDTGNPSWLERVVAMSTSKVQTIEKVPGEIPVFSLGKSTCCFFFPRNIRLPKHPGWWYTYPSEKWWSESQLGKWFPIYGKIKNVPNLQPASNLAGWSGFPRKKTRLSHMPVASSSYNWATLRFMITHRTMVMITINRT